MRMHWQVALHLGWGPAMPRWDVLSLLSSATLFDTSLRHGYDAIWHLVKSC